MGTNHSINLVSPSDPASLRFVERVRKHKDPFIDIRQRDPFAQNYNKKLILMEHALREYISASVTCIEERILSYPFVNSYGRPDTIYREIDFVCGDANDPLAFLEFKTQEKNKGANKALSQVHRCLMAARPRWAEVRGLVIQVFMGNLYGLEVDPPNTDYALEDIFDFINNPPLHLEAIWIDGEELITEAVQMGVLPENYAEELVRSRYEARNPCRILPSGDDSFGSLENVFSDRLAVSSSEK